MNITFIHVFEALVVLLVIVKLFQIRKLYIQSARRKPVVSSSRRQIPQKSTSLNQRQQMPFQQSPAKKIFQEATSGFSRQGLPLPEVSFTEGLPLPEVSYLPESNREVSNEHAYTKNDSVLNSYIDDMFFESRFEFVEEPKSLKLKKQDAYPPVADEFITVAQENAQLVRELEMFNQNLSFMR